MPVESRPNLIGGENVPMTSGHDAMDRARQQAAVLQEKLAAKKKPNLQDTTALALSLQAEHTATREEFQRLLAELNGRLLESTKQLNVGLSQLETTVEKDRQRTSEMVHKTAEEVTRSCKEATVSTGDAVSSTLQDQISSLKANLEAQLSRQGKDLAEQESLLGLTRRELASTLAVSRLEHKLVMKASEEALRAEIKVMEQGMVDTCMQAFSSSIDEMQKSQARALQELKARTDQGDEKYLQMDRELNKLTAQVEHNRQHIEDVLKRSSDGLAAVVSDLSETHGQHLERLDLKADELDRLVSQVENLPTRRIDWRIQDANRQLATMALQNDMRTSPPNWVSPFFEAAGCDKLQMELRFLRPSEIQANQEEDSVAIRGDCVLELKADPGLFLVCRLYIGTAFVQLEHSFADGQPFCTKPVCYIRDQIDPNDGSLVLGLEILEAVRSVQREDRLKMLPPAEEPVSNEPQLDGAVVTHRYINHRMLDLVQNQVDLIRSEKVRRIEWRLEKASQMRRCFPEGECLCSTTFEAAGVDHLQLVFYPSGYTGVREGFCSFFLHCPAGALLKFWLAAGKERREAKVAFEKPGFFGRTNFCRFESCIEPTDDTILLVLEIEEAQQNTAELLSHQTKVSTVSTKQAANQIEDHVASVTALNQDLNTPPPEKMSSSLRLQKVPGNKALQETRQLPSIWTSVPKADIAETLEGYHSFNELKAKRPLTSGMMRNSGKQNGVAWKDPHPPPPMTARQQQSPNNHRYLMYAQ